MASAKTDTAAMPLPILTLPRVTIRPYHLNDAPDASRLANDPEVAKYLRDRFPHPYTLQDSEYFITNVANQTTSHTPDPSAPLQPGGILLNYALCRSSDGAFIGAIGLQPRNDVEARTIEVGYWLGREHWGRGYCTEAVRGFSRWAFETFPDVQRLEGTVQGGNAASQAVLLKAGYQAEGVRRKAIWKHGKAWDMLIFGMLRDECPGLEGGKGAEGP